MTVDLGDLEVIENMERAARPAGSPLHMSRRQGTTWRLDAKISDRWAHSITVGLILVYTVSVFLVHRSSPSGNPVWDGGVYNLAALLPAIPMIRSARRYPNYRLIGTAMAIGVTLNTVDNLVYTYHDQYTNHAAPTASNILSLLSYLAFAVGVVAFILSTSGRTHASVRLDGAIAGLAVASVVGITYGSLLQTSGSLLQTVANAAYPMCDLAVVVLLVVGLASHQYRPNWPTVFLMFGITWFVVGDTICLGQNSWFVPGALVNSTYLVGMLFMSLAGSVRDRRQITGWKGQQGPAGVLVPVTFGLIAVTMLTVSLFDHVPVVIPVLAIAAMILVVVRMGVTLHEVRHSMINYQDARTDYLTGLPNRRAFLEKLRQMLQEDDRPFIGVLLMDLNGFKEVNDTLGHPIGDNLLCVVARRFETCVNGTGMLARLGGDEYAYAICVDSLQQLQQITETLSSSLDDPCMLAGIAVHMEISIGQVLARRLAESEQELLRQADVAMYEAKRAQIRVATYRAVDDGNSRERLELLDHLRTAVARQNLVLHYQPTLNLSTGQIHGVEALVRWPKPDGELLYPDQFIPLAEQNGLMPNLTGCVLDQAVAQAARWAAAGHQLQMSINISRYDLADEHLVGYIDAILDKYQYPSGSLTLEITESALGGDPERSMRCVQQMRARGLRISIDDFGVGYSSMSQLLRLSADELKIDKSFVLNLASDPRTHAIVRATVALARALDLAVVAEGIEDEPTLLLLDTLGVDIGQGYFISHPLPAEALDQYLLH